MTSLTASNDSNTLASEDVGSLSLRLYKRPGNHLELLIYHEGEYLTGWYQQVSEFEAGRLFQAEFDAYRRILK